MDHVSGGAVLAFLVSRPALCDRYRTALRGPDDSVTVWGVLPGGYRLWAWDNIEPNAYLNVDFMSGYLEPGTPVRITAPSKRRSPSGLLNLTGEQEKCTIGRMTQIQIPVLAIALSIAIGIVGSACSTHRSPEDPDEPGKILASRRMADGKEWTTANVNVNASASYCYDDAEPNCGRYGRLYTWESAQRVCESLAGGWRLPTDGEWRQMAKLYGGVSDDSADKGMAAFTALLNGGTSGFSAALGGNRSADGQYARLDAHGLYWTASDNDSGSAPFYNFAKNGQALHRQPDGEKQMAISVRCVRE
ncbi:MAG TPA: FISUMP domain-containing protein [Terriglobia bacterium]|nr:FISUMP domain-containing protein [Terriglobia bacterium]